MTRILYRLFLLLLLPVSFCYGNDENNSYLAEDINQALFNLEGWDNHLIKEQLILRIKDNQHLITFLNEYKLGKSDQDTDESFQVYVNSLMEDQKNLAYIAGQLVAISNKENIDIDGAFIKKPFFHLRLKKNLNENLERKSSDILLFKMLYFSLMDKYAVR